MPNVLANALTKPRWSTHKQWDKFLLQIVLVDELMKRDLLDEELCFILARWITDTTDFLWWMYSYETRATYRMITSTAKGI